MDYGKILSKSWQVIWKNKILWLFGFLASCGSGGVTNSYNFNSSSSSYQLDEADLRDLSPEFERFFRRIAHFFEFNADRLWLFITLIILVVLVIAVLSFFLRVYGQVGLVRGALIVDGSTLGEDEKLTFRQAREEIKPYFWRLAGLRFLIFLVGFLVALVGIGVIALGTLLSFGLGMICFIPLLCLLVPVSWAISVVLKQAELALIVDDLAITDAVRRGYDVVRLNLGEYVIMALILMIGGGVVGFIFAIPQLIAMAPLFGAFLGSTITEDWSTILTGLWVSLACLLAYWPVLLVLRGVLTSYIETSWLLTFLEASRVDPGNDEIEIIEPELEPA